MVFLVLFATGCLGQTNAAKNTSTDRVFGDTIIIFPGEILHFNAKIKNNKLVKISEKKPVDDSTNTLIVSLDEKSLEDDNIPSILTIYNPFEKELFYKAQVKYKKNPAGFVSEGVLPVSVKKTNRALWSKQVEAVRVFNLTLK